jgi:pimeloyl-ACP methyl ester carboxylesterase
MPYAELRREGRDAPVALRLYDAPGATAGVVLVGGVGGGFDTPARGLYERLGETLPHDDVMVLRVRYRHPTDLAEAVADVVLGLDVLAERGVERVGLVGHSFGGAVVLQAAAADPRVAAVVTLATQSYGADAVTELAGRPLLLVHGTADAILPPACSVSVHERAGEPKELVLLRGAGHGLDEDADDVFDLVQDWLRTRLQSGR